MTRTDVMASSRPGTAGAAQSRRRRASLGRGLSVLPAALLLTLALVLPSAAMAEEVKSGYSETTPTKSTSTKTTPETGTLPSKEAEKPAATTTPTTEAAPETSTSTTPTTEQASTLPFTGFNLSWDIGFGLVLIAAGFSILAIQRRQRRHSQH